MILPRCSMFLFIYAFLLTGCSVFSDPNKSSLSVCGNGELNPDVNGQPSPVDVLLFQLKNSQLFEGEEFLELYQNSKKSSENDVTHFSIYLRPPLYPFLGLRTVKAKSMTPKGRVVIIYLILFVFNISKISN